MNSTVKTREMARAVLDYIAANPEKHDQNFWNIDGSISPTGCGTTMCIGGTATWLQHGKISLEMDTETEAGKLLGLNRQERDVLFYEMDNKRALAKLEKVAAGIEFDKDDFYTSESGDPDDELYFNEDSWNDYRKNLTTAN